MSESHFPIYYRHVLKKMYPKLKEGVDYVIPENSYSALIWNGKDKPSLQEIEAAFLHLHLHPNDDEVSKAEIKAVIGKGKKSLWAKFKGLIKK